MTPEIKHKNMADKIVKFIFWLVFGFIKYVDERKSKSIFFTKGKIVKKDIPSKWWVTLSVG
jgi:hypothetical protein